MPCLPLLDSPLAPVVRVHSLTTKTQQGPLFKINANTHLWQLQGLSWNTHILLLKFAFINLGDEFHLNRFSNFLNSISLRNTSPQTQILVPVHSLNAVY